MSSLSTPISRIRNNNNQSVQSLPPPQSNKSGNSNMQLPIYDANPENLMITQNGNQNNQYQNNQYQNNNNQQQSQTTLVDELLTELEAQPEYQQDINVAQTQYAMDNINVPPVLNEQHKRQLQSENTQAISSKGNYLTNKENDYSFDNENFTNNNDWKYFFMIELKPLLIVFVLFFVLSLHQVNRIIFSFVPKLLLENGQLSLYAILMKSILACMLYYLFMKLI